MREKYDKLISLISTLLDYAKANLPTSFSEKENNELVSEVDSYIEKEIKEFIIKNFPGESIWGEESGGDEGGWLIDPIDGTRHYLYGVPLSSISLVQMVKGESLFAIVANIMTGEMFIAQKGKGALMIKDGIETVLKFNHDVPVNKTIVSWDHVMQDKTEAEWASHCYSKLLMEFSRTRMFGSGALSLCYIAKNYFQIFIKSIRKTKEKADIFAGLLIAREAGANLEIVKYKGMDFYLVGTKNAIGVTYTKVLD